MKRLLAIVVLVSAGCASPAPTPGPSSAVITSTASPSPAAATATPNAVPTPARTPNALIVVSAHLVQAIDELDQLVASGGDVTGWALTEGTWFTDNVGSTIDDPAILAYSNSMIPFLTAVKDGGDVATAAAGVIATRNALAKIAGQPATTPRPTPVPPKPIVMKGKGTVNTKPFAVAAGDYTVVITGTGSGNIIADLTLRDKSDYVPLFNEIKHGKYRYSTIIYAVAAGSYFFDMEVDGTWAISLTPFAG